MSEPEGILGEHTIRWFHRGFFDAASGSELQVADLSAAPASDETLFLLAQGFTSH